MEEDNPFGDLADTDYNSYECSLPTPANDQEKGYKFVEYHKIDLGRRGKSNAPKDQASNTEWIVLEKVHGANFSFYCEGMLL